MQPIDFTLILDCPDEKGIISRITEYVYARGGSIDELNQIVDQENNHFFMRCRVVSDDFAVPFAQLETDFRQSQYAKTDYHIAFYDNLRPLRAVVFTTRSTHCLFDLFQRSISKEWNLEMHAIVSNHDHHRKYGEMFGVPFHHTPSTDKEAMERAQLKIIGELRPDIIILAKYMQIVSGSFLENCACPVINIHHSFLPSFVGANPYRAAYEKGVKIIGATSHFVTEDLDQGPIIEQEVQRIYPADSVKDYIRKGKDVEKIVLSRAVRSFVERKIVVYGNRCVVFS